MKNTATTTTFPLDIQFFAEGEAGAAEPQESVTKQEEKKQPDGLESEVKQDDDDGEESRKELSIEEKFAEVQKQLANANAKNKMLEKKLDKTKAGLEEYRTKWNESLTDVQREEQERKEREAEKDERLAYLEKKDAVNELTKNYLKLGYPEDKAEEIARAMYEGDHSTIFRIQSEVKEIERKTWEADFIKSNPQIITGVGGTQEEDEPLVAGFKSAMKKSNF